MFCPKCGTENPQEGKFCRKYGTDLAGVARAIGSETHTGTDLVWSGLEGLSESGGGDVTDYSVSRRRDRHRPQHPDDLMAAGIRSAVMGIGFVIISAVLFFTGVAGGHGWWWAMLIPGFTMLASGLGNVAKAKRVEKRLTSSAVAGSRGAVQPGTTRGSLEEARTDFVAPEKSDRYQTGEIVPPSVVEGTTRHLEMDTEGETMTLPEIDKQ